MEEVSHGIESAIEWFIGSNSGLVLISRLVVHDDRELRREILDEAHKYRYSNYPSEPKMWKELRHQFWLHKIKKDIIMYVTRCITCL